MVKKFIGFIFGILFLVSLGCSGTPKIVMPTPEDQIIIDVGTAKAKELGLKPFPLIGEGTGGKYTVIAPAVITYNRQGKWITSKDDLYINATQASIVLKGVTIKRGQFAREVNDQLRIVE